MNRLIAVFCIMIFALQLGVKTMVAIYYQTVASSKAIENCEYKTITVCKGSCFVAKQIKIVSSGTKQHKKEIPQLDLSNFKDAAFLEQESSGIATTPASDRLLDFVPFNHGYSFNYSSDLLKPPAV